MSTSQQPTSQKLTPSDIMQKFYTAERIYMDDPTSSNLDLLLSTLSTDIRIVQSPALPWVGIWKGHEGFKAWGEQMAENFDILDVQDPVTFTQPDENNGVKRKVLISSRIHFRVRRTKRDLHYPMVQAVVFDVEKGVIEEIQPWYWNVQELVAALKDN